MIKIYKETDIIQQAKALYHSRQKRYKSKRFIVESVAAINIAKKFSWQLETLFIQEKSHYSQWAVKIREQYVNAKQFEISASLMATITNKEDLPELIAIYQSVYQPFTEFQLDNQSNTILVLDSPKSAGNVGMILRSAYAFGCTAVVISGHAADVYDPKCVKASLGALFALPIYFVENASQFFSKIMLLKKHFPLKIIATGNAGTLPLPTLSLNKTNYFIIIGNETNGVSKAYRDMADDFIHIPLASSHFTSLNAGVAASIILYELRRQA